MEPRSRNTQAEQLRSLELATLASLVTSEQQDATLASSPSRDAAIALPTDLPVGEARDRLSGLFNCGVFRTTPVCPSPVPAPSEWPGQEGAFPTSLLLDSTVLRAGVRAEGVSPLGALVAGSGAPAAPRPDLLWDRDAIWLGSHCAGSFRGTDFPFTSFVAHLSRGLGMFLSAPHPSSALEEWRVFTNGRRFVEKLGLCDDIRRFPFPLAAAANFICGHPVRVWGPDDSFPTSVRVALSTLVRCDRFPLSGLPLEAALSIACTPSAAAMAIFDSRNFPGGMWRAPRPSRTPHTSPSEGRRKQEGRSLGAPKRFNGEKSETNIMSKLCFQYELKFCDFRAEEAFEYRGPR